MKSTIVLFFVAAAAFAGCGGTAPGSSGEGIRIEVKAAKLRPKPGDTVRIDVSIEPSGKGSASGLEARLIVPTKGARELALVPAGDPGRFSGEVKLEEESPQGFYGITVTALTRRGSAAAVRQSELHRRQGRRRFPDRERPAVRGHGRGCGRVS